MFLLVGSPTLPHWLSFDLTAGTFTVADTSTNADVDNVVHSITIAVEDDDSSGSGTGPL